MRVTIPSPCGCTVVERRERSVAMNSEVSSTVFGASVIMPTPAGGGPDAAGPAACWLDLPQATESDRKTRTAATRGGIGGIEEWGSMESVLRRRVEADGCVTRQGEQGKGHAERVAFRDQRET